MSRRSGNWDALTGGAVVGAAAANRRKQDEIIRQQRLGLAQDAEQARRALISELDDLIERLNERGADATVGDYFAHLAYALADLEAALRAASFKKEKALMKRVSPGSIYFVIDPLKGYASDYLRISQSLGTSSTIGPAPKPRNVGIAEWARSRYSAAWERFQQVRTMLADHFDYRREAPFLALTEAFPKIHPDSFLKPPA